MRSAQVYIRRRTYFINPMVGTPGGTPCLFSAPVTVLPVTASDRELGDAVRSALATSHLRATWPTDWKALLAPLLTAAGVKNWADFAKGALYVQVDEQDGRIAFIPTTSKKEKSGFSPKDGVPSVTALSDEPAHLGEALRDALTKCD